MAIQTVGDKGSDMSGWAALAKVGGDLASSALGLYASSKAWRRQREAAQNAHQWEVEDLRKAGLNPILSATGGSGASAGSASVPAGLGVDLGGAISTAQNVENSKYANQLKKQQETLADKQGQLVDEQKSTEKTKQRANLEQGALYSALASAKELENFIPSYYIDGLRRNPKDLQRALDQYKSKVVKDSIGGSLGSMNALGALILNSAKSFSQ